MKRPVSVARVGCRYAERLPPCEKTAPDNGPVPFVQSGKALRFTHVEALDALFRTALRDVDAAYVGLVAGDVLLQGEQQPLGVFGARIIRLFTLAFGTPGSTAAKSRTNSEVEWEIIARLA